jgi:L-rhamnose isomerase
MASKTLFAIEILANVSTRYIIFESRVFPKVIFRKSMDSAVIHRVLSCSAAIDKLNALSAIVHPIGFYV